MATSFMDFLDLLEMMLFSMLSALVLIEWLSARRNVRVVRRVGLWRSRLFIVAFSLGPIVVLPAFAAALFLVAILLVVVPRCTICMDRRNSVFFNLFT